MAWSAARRVRWRGRTVIAGRATSPPSARAGSRAAARVACTASRRGRSTGRRRAVARWSGDARRNGACCRARTLWRRALQCRRPARARRCASRSASLAAAEARRTATVGTRRPVGLAPLEVAAARAGRGRAAPAGSPARALRAAQCDRRTEGRRRRRRGNGCGSAGDGLAAALSGGLRLALRATRCSSSCAPCPSPRCTVRSDTPRMAAISMKEKPQKNFRSTSSASADRAPPARRARRRAAPARPSSAAGDRAIVLERRDRRGRRRASARRGWRT